VAKINKDCFAINDYFENNELFKLEYRSAYTFIENTLYYEPNNAKLKDEQALYSSMHNNIDYINDAVKDVEKELNCLDLESDVEDLENSVNQTLSYISQIESEAAELYRYIPLVEAREEFWRDLAISLIESKYERESWLEKIEELIKNKEIENIIK